MASNLIILQPQGIPQGRVPNAQSMNKKSVFLFLFFIIIAAAGAWYYLGPSSSSRSDDLQLSDLIPNEAILVYETPSPYQTVQKIGNTSIWKSLAAQQLFAEVETRLSYIDTIDHLRENVVEYFQSTPLSISLHVISKNDLGLIYYTQVRSESDEQLLSKVLEHLKNKRGAKVKERSFEGFKIMDIHLGEDVFSLFNSGGFLVASPTGFLIEDVIRTINDSEKPSLFQEHESYFDLARIKNDEGDLFLNLSQLPVFLNSVFDPRKGLPITSSSQFSSPIFTDIRWQEENIFLSGSTTDPIDPDHFLNLFKGERSSSQKLAKLAPNNTAAFYEYGFSDGISFLEKFKTHLKHTGGDSLLQSWYDYGQNQEIYFEPFFNFLDGSLALGVLEKHLSGDQPLLYLASISDTRALEDYFIKMREKAGVDSSEIIDEMYGRYSIKEIPVSEFPAHITGPFFMGFPRSFYVIHDSTLVISNRLAGLRSFINSSDQENNWGKSVKVNLFFEKALNPANITAVFNVPRLFKSLLGQLQPYWAAIFLENETALKKFEMISAQWNSIDDKFYTNVTLKHSTFSLEESVGKETQRVFMSSLPREIRRRPKIVRSHKDKSLESLLQLTDNSISLISRSGKVLWNVEGIDGELVSDPIQVDYYRNGKLQYIFATAKSIYLVDRLGRMVEGFPIRFFKEGIDMVTHFNVVDYDRTRKYRFLLADNRGRVYLTDKEGRKLEGWNPKNIGKNLATTPFHTRINGKDIIVILTQNGELHALKRNGKYYSGFPLKFDMPFSDEMFMVHGPGFSSSKLNLLSDNGTFYSVNFQGKVLSKNQLIRENPNSKFSLAISKQGEDFVITRYEGEKVALINPDFNLMFETELHVQEEPIVQFYDFEGDHELFGILERPVSKLRIFNKSGKEYPWSPFTADQEVAILFYDDINELKIFKSFKNEYSSITIKPEK